MLNFKTTTLLILLLAGTVINRANANETPGLITKVSGQGQPVVLIPGLTCAGEVWDETIANLGEGYEYHVITLPGFAGNQPIANHEGKYLEKMRDLILDYIQKQQLEKPIIIGHSLGGFLALTISIAEPDLPSKLVIVDSLPFLPGVQMVGMSSDVVKSYAQNMKTQMVAGASQPEEARANYQRVMLKSLIIDSLKIEKALEWGLQSDTETTAQAMYELYTLDMRDEIAKIKVPTLVLGAYVAYTAYGSTRESVMKSYTDQYAKLEGVTVDLTDIGNHFIMWDDPEFFINWLNKFL